MTEPPRSPLPGGDLERAVFSAVCDLGRATTPEVYARVGEPAGRAYTTVAKVLDRRHAMGLVARRRRARTFAYTARADRDDVERARALTLVKQLLGPEPRPAMAALVEAIEALNPALLDELRRHVEARRRSRRGP